MKNSILFITLISLQKLTTLGFGSTLNYSVGARSAAMGNSSVVLQDSWSAQHNQAGLAYTKDYSSALYYENRFFIKEISLKSLVVALPIKKATLGLLVTNFGYKLYQDNKIGLSFAKLLTNNFAVGVQFAYLNTRIAEGYGSKSAVAGEIGFIGKPTKNLTVGAHIFNVTKAAYTAQEKIPTTLRIGIGYSFSDKVQLTAETEKNNLNSALLKTGVEYTPIKALAIRAGVASAPNYALLSLGFGYKIGNLQTDISSNFHPVLGITSQIGIAFSVNKSAKNAEEK
ncbi:MAG: hypothetical protein J0M08_03710 [Bacteroidetes bacterium]|nr:hypothetical protein [Bacteroidota bacterium]